MPTITKPVQDFIDATKKQLASITSQLTSINARFTKDEAMISSIQATMKVPSSTPQAPFVYIVSSALASLPSPGNRVGPGNAANMPTIIGTAAGTSAISTSNGAHHYRFVGIEIKPKAGDFIFALVNLGNADTSLSTLPHDITFDRCYIHGDPTVGGRRGVAMNGASVAVIDSHVSDFKEAGADTQALWAYNSPGPLKIVNNHLEGSGENVMTGGKGASITNLLPSDIEIRRNHFFKPLSWVPLSWTVKNLLEFKNAQRVLVEGNVFENSWAAAQAGWAILLTPRNDEGVTPWHGVQDITFRLNKLINVGQGITGLGRDNVGGSTFILQRVLIENNLTLIQNIANEDHRLLQFLNAAALSGAGPNNLTIRHNTGLILSVGAGGTGASMVSEMLGTKADQLDFRDNLLSAGSDGNGFYGSGTASGTPTLVAYYTNYSMLNNAFIQGSGTYPATNLFPANTGAVGFVDYAGGNYRLTSGSAYHNAASDGTDIGANIDSIDAAILHASDGQWGSEPPTYSTGAGTVAEVPRTFLDTTYRPQSGATIAVHSGGDLQAAINSANLGDTIVVDAGASFTLNLNLPAK